jgi:hypothetical protein
MARPHLLLCYRHWIARAEAEGTPAGLARAAQRRRELARIEAAMLARRVVWIGVPPDELEPITRAAFDAMTGH